MEISSNYLRSLGFRRKRNPNTAEYQLDVPYSYGDWVTIVIAKVGGNWVIKKIKTTGDYGRKLVSDKIVRSSIDEVMAVAEYLRYGSWPESKKVA